MQELNTKTHFSISRIIIICFSKYCFIYQEVALRQRDLRTAKTESQLRQVIEIIGGVSPSDSSISSRNTSV